MKVTYNWLRDFVDIKLKPQDLAHQLTMAGLEVTALEEKDGDVIFEIEVTPNRPDCLSVIGVAREVAAITGKKLKVPAIKLSKNVAGDCKIKNIHIENKSDSPVYTARPILGIKVKPSQGVIKKRLELVGLRSVNNIVDITNYCLLETGQPPHAFDLDKIKGNTIFVRRAKQGEKIITIDGIERKLTKDILVIADSGGPIAIAGIMGGKSTEVTASTKNILLENACFNPILIRRGCRILGLSSDSSYRFERQVDPAGILPSTQRVTQLILKEMPAKSLPIMKKVFPMPAPAKIELDIAYANRVLGADLTSAKIKNILLSLGLKIISASAAKLKVQPPGSRPDLKIQEDLIEEISRIYGYEKINLTLPAVKPHLLEKDFIITVQEKAYSILINLGLSETINYSLISENLLQYLKLTFDAKDSVKVVNPLSIDQAVLRPTLLAGLLNSVAYNLNRKRERVAIFEMGKIFLNDKNVVENYILNADMRGFHADGRKLKNICSRESALDSRESALNNIYEKVNLGIALTGIHHNDWLRKKDTFSIFDLKGIIEELFKGLGVQNYKIVPATAATFTQGAAFNLKVKDKILGVMGRVSSDCLEAWDIADKEIFAAEIYLEQLAGFAKLEHKFQALSPFPTVKRDISLVLNEDIAASSVVEIARQKAGTFLKNIAVFDCYAGKQIPQGQKSLSFSLEYGQERNLTDEEVNRIHTEVCQAIQKDLGAQIR